MSRGRQMFTEKDAARLVRAAKQAGLFVRGIEADFTSGKLTVLTNGGAVTCETANSLQDTLDRELAEFEARHAQG